MSVKIIKHDGGLYTLYAKQTVAKEIDVIWDFFRKPRNLNKLTPADVEFKIISERNITDFTCKTLNINRFSCINSL